MGEAAPLMGFAVAPRFDLPAQRVKVLARAVVGLRLSAVTLDFWHTLAYLEPDEEEAYMRGLVDAARAALAESPPRAGTTSLPEGQLARCYERALADAVASANEGRTVTLETQFRRAAEWAGREPRYDLFLAGIERQVRATRFRRAPGALEMLAELRKDEHHLAIVSNTVGEPGALLRPVLHDLGIDRYVATQVFSDEHPWTKPSPEIFRATLALLGQDSERTVHVGDGWSDVEGARRAGFRASLLYEGLPQYAERYRALFVRSDWVPPAPEFRVPQLTDVPARIRAILSEPVSR